MRSRRAGWLKQISTSRDCVCTAAYARSRFLSLKAAATYYHNGGSVAQTHHDIVTFTRTYHTRRERLISCRVRFISKLYARHTRHIAASQNRRMFRLSPLPHRRTAAFSGISNGHWLATSVIVESTNASKPTVADVNAVLPTHRSAQRTILKTKWRTW